MNDNELRGLILRKYYDRQREQYVELDPCDFTVIPVSKEDILHISSQLADYGLIEFVSARESKGQLLAGRGHILAPGVDVVENGGVGSPVTITFDHSSHVTVSSSSHVQMGDGNVQVDDITIQKLVAAIDHSNALDGDKAEAKSRLAKFLEHPLVNTITGKLIPDIGQIMKL